MNRMLYHVVKDEMPMTIECMYPHWAYNNFDISGDSIVSFTGPFEVSHDDFIDIRSLKSNISIESGTNMLHFVLEHFNSDLQLATYRQYLLVSIVEEKLVHRIGRSNVIRWADDLFDGEHLLSMSAVTKTPVSTKIHLGLFVNDDDINKRRGLIDMGITPCDFADAIIGQYRTEFKRLADKVFCIRPIS